MPTATWKNFERFVAEKFGGKRRGPIFRDEKGGTSDVIVRGFAIECKQLGRVSYADFLHAVEQAERAATELEIPVATIHKKNAPMRDTMAVMRLETFIQWFGGDSPPLPLVSSHD